MKRPKSDSQNMLIILIALLGALDSAAGFQLFTTDCLGAAQAKFHAFQASVNFTTAKSLCEQSGMTIARIDDASTYNVVTEALQNAESLESMYIGLEDVVIDGFTFESSRFEFIDGANDNVDFIQVGQGVFPWQSGSPNSADQKCVIMKKDLFFLDDVGCEELHGYVCRETCSDFPTVEPTKSPSSILETDALECQDVALGINRPLS